MHNLLAAARGALRAGSRDAITPSRQSLPAFRRPRAARVESKGPAVVLTSLLGSGLSPIVQYAIAFAVIAVLLSLFMALLRRFSRRRTLGGGAARGRQPRLGIVDVYEFDRQRQLVLLRRDNVEHLILVGGPNDLVVERNIQRGVPARLPGEEAQAADPAPTPVLPMPPVAAPSPAQIGSPPTLEPLPKPEPGGRPDPGRRPDPGGRPEPVTRPEPTFELPRPAPVPPVASAPVVEPPRSRVEVGRVEPSLPAPAAARTAPAVEPVRPPEPAKPSEPRTPEAGKASRPRATPLPLPPLPEGQPPLPQPEARSVDATILSDMARQLEEALKRPASAVAPSSAAQAPRPQSAPELARFEFALAPTAAAEPPPRPAPLPAQPPVAKPVEKPAETPAAPAPAPAPAPAAAPLPAKPPEDTPEPAIFEPPPPEPDPAPTGPPPADLPMPEPRPEPARPSDWAKTEATPMEAAQIKPAGPEALKAEPADIEPVDAKPAETESADAKSAEVRSGSAKSAEAGEARSGDPFSVEEIEAEFARLLGRPLDRKG